MSQTCLGSGGGCNKITSVLKKTERLNELKLKYVQLLEYFLSRIASIMMLFHKYYCLEQLFLIVTVANNNFFINPSS